MTAFIAIITNQNRALIIPMHFFTAHICIHEHFYLFQIQIIARYIYSAMHSIFNIPLLRIIYVDNVYFNCCIIFHYKKNVKIHFPDIEGHQVISFLLLPCLFLSLSSFFTIADNEAVNLSGHFFSCTHLSKSRILT